MKKIVDFFNQDASVIQKNIVSYILSLPYKTKAFLLIFCGILLYIPYANTYNTWHDDQASMLLMNYPWKEMFRLISIEDGHPPLFHTIYRLFQLGGDYHNVLALRIATLFVFFLTAMLGIFPVRRLLGDKASLIYIILVFVLPSSIYLGINIRMYPLALYAMTGAFAYSMLVIKNESRSDWFYFALFSIIGLYTHYLCAILLFCIWSVVFFVFLSEKQYKNILKLLLLGLIVALIFSPWMYAFITQYGYMKNLWFPTKVLRDESLWGTVFGFRLLKNRLVYFGVISLGFLCWYIILSFMQQVEIQKTDKKLVKYAIITFWGMYIIAYLISVFLRPMIFERLLIVPMGILYITLSYIFSRTPKYNKIFLLLCIPVFLITYSHYYGIANDTSTKEFVTEFRKKTTPKDSLIIYDGSFTQLFSDFYFSEYPKIFAPKRINILLFEDEVINELKNENKLDNFSHIYYFSIHTEKENVYLENILLAYKNKGADFSVITHYFDAKYEIFEISKDDAKAILNLSKPYFQIILHKKD